jgi:hypothetical protein
MYSTQQCMVFRNNRFLCCNIIYIQTLLSRAPMAQTPWIAQTGFFSLVKFVVNPLSNKP